MLGRADAHSIDTAARRIVTSKGSYSYGALVLALGAGPFQAADGGYGRSGRAVGQ